MDIKDFIIKNAAGNLYWKNKDGIYQGCNDAFAKLLKLKSSHEILGKNDFDLMPDKKMAKKIINLDKKVMESGREMIIEEIGVNLHGDTAFYLSHKKPIKNEKGEVIGIIGTSIDITKQKESDRIKSEFVSNMEHDIRTPLSGLLLIANNLWKTEKNIERKELLNLVAAASKRLLDIHNEILTFRKIEFLPSEVVEFNIKNLLQEVIDLMMPEVKLKNLDIIFSCPDENIKCDKRRISRIFLNLFSNSVRHTKKGYIQIIIKTKPKLRIEVKDTGIGIPKDKLRFIFDRFTKVELSESHPDFTGLGIGLNMVKRFSEDLGGKITVTSELGKGSCFVFSL